MKVFITGATGYIGFNVALEFRRAGHEVWGLARSAVKAQPLLHNEIRPVIGAMEEPGSYLKAAAACSVLIHAASDPAAPAEMDRKTLEALISTGNTGAQPKTLIYTSGVWVHGDTNCEYVDETAPLKPAKLVTWRPAAEQLALNAKGMRGIVIRPGCVYGKEGGLTGMWFGGASSGQALDVVGGRNHWALVHACDLAIGYRLIAESGVSSEVFDLVDNSRETVGEMAAAAAKAAGNTAGVRFIPVAQAAQKMGDFAECLALDQHVDSGKARYRVGWMPQHRGFASDASLYYASWKASQR
jgi:nucleoside-diphosphate-sugar epimerase